MIRAGAIWLTCALTACASLEPSVPVGGEVISGRLSLRVEAQGVTPARALAANFDLRGAADAGQLDLSSPLGSLLARARWSARDATLTTPQGVSHYADLDTLTRELLGEPLPVVALFDWLHGRPWPGAPGAPSESGFAQLGWTVHLDRYPEGWIAAERTAAPAASLRARVDPP